MSKEYFDIWTKRFEKMTPVYEAQPREDYTAVSAKYPIFVVADGVTLKRDQEGNYPDPSGAYEAAKLFCEKVIEEAEKVYENFSESDIQNVFAAGNTAVKKLNDSHGIVEGKLDFRGFDYFSTTTSFALIKDGILYWWTMHDCGLEVLSPAGDVLFRAPKVVPNKERFFVGQTELTETELNKAIRSTYRNKLGEQGELVGYGVVTGEEAGLAYLSRGTKEVATGSTVVLFSDGFENYVELKEFNTLLAENNQNKEELLEKYSEEKIKESPKLFGQERTVVAITIS